MMKKLLALLLILSICSLCFLVSCKGNSGDTNVEDPGQTEDGENGDDIIDIGDKENPGVNDNSGILNEDNIDPNGWTKVD